MTVTISLSAFGWMMFLLGMSSGALAAVAAAFVWRAVETGWP